MDETNIVTIIGMIAAFITASVTTFLAEPIKDYYINKGKIIRLRTALYKELIFDYLTIKSYISSIKEFRVKEADSLFRNECYKEALTNDVSLFYQLNEAIDISYLHSIIKYLMGDLKTIKRLPNKYFVENSNLFIDRFTRMVYIGILDNTLIRSCATKTEYDEMKKRGQEVLEKEKTASSDKQESKKAIKK